MAPRQWTGRRIKHNKGNSIPRYIVALDTETIKHDTRRQSNSFSHRFRLGCFTYARIARGRLSGLRREVFRDTNTFWQRLYSLSSSKHTIWVVATKTLFDLKVVGFQDEIQHGNIYLDRPRQKGGDNGSELDQRKRNGLCVLQSPPTIIAVRARSTGGKIIFVDTLNWFKVPVSDLGDACGLPKLQMPDMSESDDAWSEYCQRDTEIVFRTFAQLIEFTVNQNMGNFAYTAPGQAYNAYRHRFMPREIFAHDNPDVKNLERASYFGGRTAVFRRGPIRQDVWQYDVNSLFPFVMRANAMPYRLHSYEMRQRFMPDCGIVAWSDAIAQVRIETAESLYPCKIDSKLCYPVGRFDCVLAGKELDIAHQRGDIKAIGSWAEYDRADLFSRWVSDLYAMRLDYKSAGNKLYDLFTKSLLNSLYGKFAQLGPDWEYCGNDLSADPWSSWYGPPIIDDEPTLYRAIGYDVYKQVEKRELPNTLVAISTFVSAAARCHMNGLRQVCGSGNVYYQGVDSLIVTREGHDRLDQFGAVHPTELGKLKLDCVGNFGEIFGSQDYSIGSKVVIAGRSRKVSEVGYEKIVQHRFLGTNDLFHAQHRNQVIERLVSWERLNHGDGTTPDGGVWVSPFVLNGCESSG